MTPAERANNIINLYKQYGHADYIGEPVSQLEHMCQCAQLAAADGADEEMILAAFFHDIGHLYEHIAGETAMQMEGFGTADHEVLGADYLRKMGFSERMAKLVQSHVPAKRYLTATHAAYMQQLSEASKATLHMQGGPMSPEEVARFEADPYHQQYIQLRYWDEQAKETGKPLPDLNVYRDMIIRNLVKIKNEQH